MAEPARVRSLDGLRGIAALIVVAHHSLLTGTVTSAVSSDPSSVRVLSWAWLLGYTPLHLLWDGTFAVYVFFALSGYVLTLQMGASKHRPWSAYYPHRLLRLYVPVWAAVLLAGWWALVVPRVALPTNTPWENLHAGSTLITGAPSDALLVTNTSPLDSVLWSLHWEVVFSLLLPLVVAAVSRIGWRASIAGAAPSVLLVGLGTYRQQLAAEYLPMFVLGALVAAQRDHLERLARRWTRRHFAALAAAVLFCQWAFWPALWRGASPAVLAAATAARAAATLPLLVLVTTSPLARRVCESRASQWAGARSFSLYLVHEPIVVSAALLIGANAAAVLAVSLPASLVACAAFARFVEMPANRWSLRVGRRVAAIARRRGLRPAA